MSDSTKELLEKIDKLTSEVAELKEKSQQKVLFKVNRTNSDIEIVGGPNFIEKKGILINISASLVPSPQGASIMALASIKEDNGDLHIVPAQECKLL